MSSNNFQGYRLRKELEKMDKKEPEDLYKTLHEALRTRNSIRRDLKEMTCHLGKEFLVKFVTGVLSKEHSLAMKAHIEFCKECRDEKAEIEAMVNFLEATISPCLLNDNPEVDLDEDTLKDIRLLQKHLGDMESGHLWTLSEVPEHEQEGKEKPSFQLEKGDSI